MVWLHPFWDSDPEIMDMEWHGEVYQCIMGFLWDIYRYTRQNFEIIMETKGDWLICWQSLHGAQGFRLSAHIGGGPKRFGRSWNRFHRSLESILFETPTNFFLVGGLLPFLAFSQKYWVSIIIPMDFHIFQRAGLTTNHFLWVRGKKKKHVL